MHKQLVMIPSIFRSQRARQQTILFFVAALAALAAAFVFQRPLVAAAAAQPQNIFGTTTPAVTAVADPANVELGLRFKAAVDGQINGVRFYKGTGNTGTHTGSLWTGSTRTQTGTFTGETASGWQTLTFATPVNITAGTVYTVSYLAPNGNYAVNNPYIFPKTTGDLTAIAGTYQYGGGYPNQAYQTSNYWVDPIFTPSAVSSTVNIFGAKTPTVAADPDTAKVELGVQFKPAVGGQINGMRFYKSAANTGTHAGRIYDSKGNQLASATFTGETASGWQRVNFETPVTVVAGETYTASYVAPVGKYADDVNYAWPVSGGLVNGKATLTALKGTYKYGGGYPTEVWEASNYYVDVEFAPNGTTIPNPPSGWFRSDASGRIIDPNGKVFTPVGVNANGPDWVWVDPTIGESDKMAKWGFNTLRVNTCFVGGCPISDTQPADWDWHTNDDLTGIVNEYTAKKYVIMIGSHMWGGGAWTNHVPEIVAWWKATAAKYKDNPYVWFNLINEPTTDAVSDNPQVLNQWADLHSQIATAIRTVAPNNMIVMDGNTWGQEKGTWSCDPTKPANGAWDGAGGPYVNSAFVNKGQQMQAAYGPVLFSLHVYGMWGGNESGGCTTADWDKTFTTFVDKVHSLGLPMVIGETGSVTDKANEEWFAGGSWNAVKMLTRVLPTEPIKLGVLYWHGSGGSSFNLLDPADNWINYPPTAGHTLNWKGQFMYNYAHQVNP